MESSAGSHAINVDIEPAYALQLRADRHKGTKPLTAVAAQAASVGMERQRQGITLTVCKVQIGVTI